MYMPFEEEFQNRKNRKEEIHKKRPEKQGKRFRNKINHLYH